LFDVIFEPFGDVLVAGCELLVILAFPRCVHSPSYRRPGQFLPFLCQCK
jgi:hypothetical protein